MTKFLELDGIEFSRHSQTWEEMRELVRDRYQERKTLFYWRVLQHLRRLADEPVDFSGYSAEEIQAILWHRDTRVLGVESSRISDWVRLSALVPSRKVDWDVKIPGGLPEELKSALRDFNRATQSVEMFGVLNAKAAA